MSQPQSKGGRARVAPHKKAGKSTGGSRKGSSTITAKVTPAAAAAAAAAEVIAKLSASSISPYAALPLPLSAPVLPPCSSVVEANGGSGVVPAATDSNHGQTIPLETKDGNNHDPSATLNPSEPMDKHSSTSSEKFLAEPLLALQFGSLSPGFIHHSGTQIPARTSSAPPNLDEQRRKQVFEKNPLLVEPCQTHVISHGPASFRSQSQECAQVSAYSTQSENHSTERESGNPCNEAQKANFEKIEVRNSPTDPVAQVSIVVDLKGTHSNSESPLGISYPANTSEKDMSLGSHDVEDNQALYKKLGHKYGKEHGQIGSKEGTVVSDGHAVKISDSGGVASETSSNRKTEARGLKGSNLGEQCLSCSNSGIVTQEPKQGSKKKKKKELLAKADAAGTTADLYNAYKAPEDKKRDDTKSIEHPVMVSKEIRSADDALKPLEENTFKELDDWEEAAETPTPSATFVSGKDSLQRKVPDIQIPLINVNKYTRDFLLTFKDQSVELPLDFKFHPSLSNSLLTPEANVALAAREASLSVDRSSVSQTISDSLHERQGSLGDEHKWKKPLAIAPLGGASEFIGDTSSTSTLSSFQSVQNMNTGLLPQMHPGYHPGMPMTPPTIPGFSIHGPTASAQMMGIHPFPRLSGIDADRWQHAPSFQKGLIPSPQIPLAIMHKAENRYEVGKVSDAEEAKQRQIKSILNKLTPQNFDCLFEQVKEVEIKTAATLTGVISQIFGKALMEPTFCEMYAKFCLQLSHELPEFHEDGVKITFKRLLLNNCQEEFERGVREQQEAEKEENDHTMLTKEEREEKKVKARRRMLGNIRLIGELYKESMLTERIMHECIKKLLGEYQNPNEEDVEALCKLMTTIGQLIDHPKAKGHLDAYFDRMIELSNNKKLSSRLQFMLKDVIDLRKNEWQERRKVEGPKKIDEVHRDAAQERQVLSNRDRLTRLQSSGGSTRRSGSMNEFPLRGHMPFFSAPVGPPMPFGVRGFPGGIHAPHGQDYRMDDRSFMETRAMPMPLVQRPFVEGNVTLGPQGGLGRGYGVRNQPSLASSRSLLSDGPPAMFAELRHAALGPSLPGTNAGIMAGRVNNGGRHHEDFALRPSSADRMYLPAERFLFERPHTSDRHIVSSGRDLRGIDRSFSDRPLGALLSRPRTPPSAAYLHSVPASSQVPFDDELIRKCRSAILEYYSARDLKEAAECVDDLKAPLFHSRMLSIWISNSLEKKDNERDLLVRLLVYMRRDCPLLTHEQLIQGFQSVLSGLEDTMVDVPRAPSYIAGMIGKLLAHNVVSLRDVGKLFKEGGMEPGSLLETGYALTMFADVLDTLRKERGETLMIRVYEESGTFLEDFMVAGDNRIRMLEGVLGRTNLQVLWPPRPRWR